uniref:Uncharacterized protein n=1 Tax=Hemiselmis andersenii TaxID=464988 RepID=A0A7S0UGQ6_HEMAN
MPEASELSRREGIPSQEKELLGSNSSGTEAVGCIENLNGRGTEAWLASMPGMSYTTLGLPVPPEPGDIARARSRMLPPGLPVLAPPSVPALTSGMLPPPLAPVIQLFALWRPLSVQEDDVLRKGTCGSSRVALRADPTGVAV